MGGGSVREGYAYPAILNTKAVCDGPLLLNPISFPNIRKILKHKISQNLKIRAKSRSSEHSKMRALVTKDLGQNKNP
ncbi:hypothetical protein OUZ56_021888 [Daphnia magna]|uniref:Uncharacterized protein n=1 Tax=Daphnia magna TaxID=35525 RepID=A0ABR0AUR0_9CRUS|nr:hypothetical protein OUZ56_021888 [Daphnia magna]